EKSRPLGRLRIGGDGRVFGRLVGRRPPEGRSGLLLSRDEYAPPSGTPGDGGGVWDRLGGLATQNCPRRGSTRRACRAYAVRACYCNARLCRGRPSAVSAGAWPDSCFSAV